MYCSVYCTCSGTKWEVNYTVKGMKGMKGMMMHTSYSCVIICTVLYKVNFTLSADTTLDWMFTD